MAALLALAKPAQSNNPSSHNFLLTYDERIVEPEPDKKIVFEIEPSRAFIADLVQAQMALESDNCKRVPAPFNCWGRTDNRGGYLQWQTYQEAEENQKDYTIRLLDKCSQDLRCYAQRYGTNPRYHERLVKIMEQLK